MDKEKKALKLKTLAEQKYISSPILQLKSALKYAENSFKLFPTLDGLSELLTAFQILSVSAFKPMDWYKVLQIEPFSHINIIRKQYRKLALTLHPDKNPFPACEEAFKYVAEGFSVLSDKVKRKKYDTKLRMEMQEAVTEGGISANVAEVVDGFSTECKECSLVHRFDRKYLGHNLICPNCKKSFKALEVSDNIEDDGDKEDVIDEDNDDKVVVIDKDNDVMEDVVDKNKDDKEDVIGVRSSARIKAKGAHLSGSSGGTGEVLERSMPENSELGSDTGAFRAKKGVSTGVSYDSRALRSKQGASKSVSDDSSTQRSKMRMVTSVMDDSRAQRSKMGMVTSVSDEHRVLRPRRGASTRVSDYIRMLKPKRGSRVVGEPKSKRFESGEEGVTLADMQMQAKEVKEKMSLRVKEKRKESPKAKEFCESKKKKRKTVSEDEDDEDWEIGVEDIELYDFDKVKEEKMRLRVKEKRKENLKAKQICEVKKKKRKRMSEDEDDEDWEMEVEDPDFYDFDKDRLEKSFKKGQVWAIYEDDDGMPRRYGLIDHVSVYPFKVKLSWLVLKSGSDNLLVSWEKEGVRISCGRFNVANTVVIDSVNIFSHFMDAERAAREVYRIYPKKGSVWALYNEDPPQNSDGSSSVENKRRYDIVVCLTSYDEMYGLSMAYLEKVDEFKAVFKRREIGSYAIKSLKKDDFRLFSHQIPARKLSGEEAPDLSRDCWELDPASLPELS